MPDYSKEQLQDIYQNLPTDLQTALFSEENAKTIQDICLKNNVSDNQVIFEVAKYVGYVLLGVLFPDELPKTLEKELKLETDAAKEIAWEISRAIFLPVENTLEALYKIEIEIPRTSPSKKGQGAKVLEKSALKETEARKSAKDRYREPTEE